MDWSVSTAWSADVTAAADGAGMAQAARSIVEGASNPAADGPMERIARFVLTHASYHLLTPRRLARQLAALDLPNTLADPLVAVWADSADAVVDRLRRRSLAPASGPIYRTEARGAVLAVEGQGLLLERRELEELHAALEAVQMQVDAVTQQDE